MTSTRTRRVRDLWFSIHKWIGLGCFILLTVAGVTGAVLAFRPGLDVVLNPGLFHAPGAGPQVLSPGALARRLEAASPAARVSQLPLQAKAGEAVAIGVAPRAGRLDYDQVFVDPVDGKVLGRRASVAGWGPDRLLEGVYELHARLLAGAPGRWLMGVVSGLWAVSSLVGLYLTLPRTAPFWRAWRPVWSVNFRARLPRLMLDLHRASGLWLLPGVLALSVSGCAISFYAELAEPAALALAPSRVAALNADLPAPPGPKARRLDWDAAARAAAAWARGRDPALKPAAASFDAEDNQYRVGLTRSGRRDYVGLGPIYAYVDAATGAIAYVDDPYRDSAGRLFLRGLYPVHSGQTLGWVGRLLALVLGLATAEMSITGVWLWWRKRVIRRRG